MTLRGEITAINSPNAHKERADEVNKLRLFGLLGRLHEGLKVAVEPEESFLFIDNENRTFGGNLSVAYACGITLEDLVLKDGQEIAVIYNENRVRWFDQAITEVEARDVISSAKDDELLVSKSFSVILTEAGCETVTIFHGHRDLENGVDSGYDISPPHSTYRDCVTNEQARMLQTYALDELGYIVAKLEG